jgi:hypothetical protein
MTPKVYRGLLEVNPRSQEVTRSVEKPTGGAGLQTRSRIHGSALAGSGADVGVRPTSRVFHHFWWRAALSSGQFLKKMELIGLSK